jgi:alpha-mannosidase/mannosylglycerate hydrolase
MQRTAHYISSTHWDREWYEPFQGFRMRLVSMLDEVLDTLDNNPDFRSFEMDGQVIPIHDYLEIRRHERDRVKKHVTAGRLRIGPWYNLPDEWLVSGESLVRNLQLGVTCAKELGSPGTAFAPVVDQFGHISQLPQIFAQMGFRLSSLHRGINSQDVAGLLNWRSPDGSSVLLHKLGNFGYGTFQIYFRGMYQHDEPMSIEQSVDKMVEFALMEAKRIPVGPILLLDSCDHVEIEPHISQMIVQANRKLAEHGITIVHSDHDQYLKDLEAVREQIRDSVSGELREPGKYATETDGQWLITGTLASRIHLKQRNAECEDELAIWAEPFSAFAGAAGVKYPGDYLRVAWQHLLDNHPHDSICGCSPDQVHQDMIYRFDQSHGISSRLTDQALKAITLAAAPKQRADGALVIGLFNATADPIDEPVDIEIPLPTAWAKKFQEFFGYEEKFSFKLKDADGEEVPYQLVSQRRDRAGFRAPRYKLPKGDPRHVVTVCARVRVPAFGYTTLTVEPFDGPTRYLGSLQSSRRSIENEHLRVEVNANGTINVLDKQTNRTWRELLTFVDEADIGDGWNWGTAVNDRAITSSISRAQVSVLHDGVAKATLRIELTLDLPEAFDFKSMTRSSRTVPFRITSDVTLRRGSERVEVECKVDNNAMDHRLRVLLPSDLAADTYFADSQFDVVERSISLLPDRAARRELDIDARPQVSWTAITDGQVGLATVSRGLFESGIIDSPDRPIAITLIRAFRKAVFANDNLGGEIQGMHRFKFDIVPFGNRVPVRTLFVLGQRVNRPIRQVDLLPVEKATTDVPTLPRQGSFLGVSGDAIVTSIQKTDGGLLVRLFNPYPQASRAVIAGKKPFVSVKCQTLNGAADRFCTAEVRDGVVLAHLSAKRIATLVLQQEQA